jgi:hypothetical protein
MGMRRDFPPSGNGDDAPRLVVFKVINLKPVKGEVPWTRLSGKARCGYLRNRSSRVSLTCD